MSEIEDSDAVRRLKARERFDQLYSDRLKARAASEDPGLPEDDESAQERDDMIGGTRLCALSWEAHRPAEANWALPSACAASYVLLQATFRAQDYPLCAHVLGKPEPIGVRTQCVGSKDVHPCQGVVRVPNQRLYLQSTIG
jgi:hypothetical protein